MSDTQVPVFTAPQAYKAAMEDFQRAVDWATERYEADPTSVSGNLVADRMAQLFEARVKSGALGHHLKWSA